MKKTKAVLLGVILWSLLLASGCNFIRIEEEPRKPLEYSIVKNEDLPAELPPNGQVFYGTVSIPTALLENAKEVSLTLTDYPGQKLQLQISGIPVAK